MKSKVQWIGSFFLLIIVLFLTGCNQDAANKSDAKNDPYDFYNQVKLGALKDDIDALLGVEPDEEEGSYIYLDSKSGFGVMLMFDVNNTATMKTLYHDDEEKIMGLSDANVTESQIDSISEGMTYKEVKTLLGSDGSEIIQMTNPADPNKPIYVMIWFNPDNTGIYASFLGDQGALINVVYYDE